MIKFGTDGWRAKIADEFTFSNVTLVSQAIANHIKATGGANKPFVVGYDNRFLSEKFASTAAKVILSNGIACHLSLHALPSPALSFAVKTFNASGGIMITASHNPPEYNGLKFKAAYAGSASPTITAEIERELQKLTANPSKVTIDNVSDKEISRFDPKKKYFAHLKSFVDLNLIKNASLKVIVDPMFGSAANYLKEILKDEGILIEEINAKRDPLFGGINPEPLPKNLEELTSSVKEAALNDRAKSVIGIALDGDGDRISAVDQTGDFINPHNIFAILLKHLVEAKKMDGEVVKTFNSSNLISLIAKKYGIKVHETPIGFKYICDLMLKADILIGGEESGGIGIKGHIPERDGVLAGLLLLEAAASEKKSLKAILNSIMTEFGFYYYDRIDLKLSENKKQALRDFLRDSPPKVFAKNKVSKIETLDGTKLLLEGGSWILFRSSGTEPLLRIYCEATSRDLLFALLSEGEKMALSA